MYKICSCEIQSFSKIDMRYKNFRVRMFMGNDQSFSRFLSNCKLYQDHTNHNKVMYSSIKRSYLPATIRNREPNDDILLEKHYL